MVYLQTIAVVISTADVAKFLRGCHNLGDGGRKLTELTTNLFGNFIAVRTGLIAEDASITTDLPLRKVPSKHLLHFGVLQFWVKNHGRIADGRSRRREAHFRCLAKGYLH